MGAETLTDMQTIQQVQQNVTDYFKGNAVKNVYLSGSCVHGEEDKCWGTDLFAEPDDGKMVLFWP